MNKDLNVFFFLLVCVYIICSFNVCVYIHILTINGGGEITIHLNNTSYIFFNFII